MRRRSIATRHVVARHVVARHVAIVAIVAGAMPAAAAPDVPKAAPTVVSKAVSKLPALEAFALTNGLQVAVLRNDAAPVVSVQLWYRAGSKDEPKGHRGTAHMFEHIMFKGSARVRSDAHAQS